MTMGKLDHGQFTIERRLKQAPARAFAAWSDEGRKRRWFVEVEGWETERYSLDFREGGSETWRGGPTGGVRIANDTVIFDIVPAERIVFSYAMTVAGSRISVSVATVSFEPDGAGTRLTYTEQGVFFPTSDGPRGREAGVAGLLDRLAAALESDA